MSPRRILLMSIPVAGAMAILVLAAIAGRIGTDREPGERGASVQRPAVGQARADFLSDGTPVWVIGHGDGSVSVLSGFDTHTPLGLGKLLW